MEAKQFFVHKVTKTAGTINQQQFKIPEMVVLRDSIVQIKKKFTQGVGVADHVHQYVNRLDCPMGLGRCLVTSQGQQLFQTENLKALILNYTQRFMYQQMNNFQGQLTVPFARIEGFLNQSFMRQSASSQQSGISPVMNYQTINNVQLGQGGTQIQTLETFYLHQFFPFLFGKSQELMIPALDIQLNIDNFATITKIDYNFEQGSEEITESNIQCDDIQITFYLKQIIQSIPKEIKQINTYNEYKLGPQSFNMVLQNLKRGYIVIQVLDSNEEHAIDFESIDVTDGRVSLTLNGNQLIDGTSTLDTVASFQLSLSKSQTRYNNYLAFFINEQPELQLAGWCGNDHSYILFGYISLNI